MPTVEDITANWSIDDAEAFLRRLNNLSLNLLEEETEPNPRTALNVTFVTIKD